MKIADTYGRLFALGTIAEVPTGKLLWVDEVNGNDDLAARERLTVPFKTLTAAKNAAASGDTIVVMPGTHGTTENLAKNNVHWHLLQGAIIQGNASATIFKLDTAITMRVSGEGELLATVDHAVELTHASANLFLKCRKITATDSCVKMTAGASAYVEADALASDESSCVEISGGTLHVRARSIYSDQVYALNILGGTLDVEAYTISSDADMAVYFLGGTAVITAHEIFSNTTYAVKYDSQYSNPLTLRHARVVTKAAPASLNYVPALMISAGSGNLRIMNCALIAANNNASSPKSIDTTLGATTVRLYGLSVTNITANSNVTLDYGRFIVDAPLV